MSTQASEIDRIILRRLAPLVHNPFQICLGLGFDAYMFGLTKHKFKICREFVDCNRDGHIVRTSDEYNYGRILFFIEEIRAGKQIDAITLDCVCNGGRVYPEPLITDGWHRYAAHAYLNRKYIDVSFSGRVDLLEYLKGTRKTRPQE